MKNRGGCRGFSFSFDAFFAVIVFIVALAFIGTATSQTPSYGLQELSKKQMADDVLGLSVNLGKLQTFDKNSIQAFFVANMPPNYGYELDIDRYTYSAGNFTLYTTLKYGDTSRNLDITSYVETKKMFMTFDSAYPPNITYYNSAKLRVWVKDK